MRIPALRRLALPAIIALGAVLALAELNQHLILASDNASYIVLGQALASGRGYVMANEPSAPAMNLYPWGYPLILAGVLRLAGSVASPMQAVIPMKLAAVLFYLATLPAVYLLVRRRHSETLALLTALLVAVNPSVLSLATEVLSEMPFVFFSLLGLLLVESFEMADPGRGARSASLLLLGGLSLAAGYYMRTAALAILVAASVYLLSKHRIRAGVGLGAMLAALALPWFLRSSSAPTPETPFFARSYLYQVLAAAPYSDQSVTLLGLVSRIITNSLTYATQILPETMFPHLASLGRLAAVAGAGMAALLLLGFIIEVRRGLRVGELSVGAYWLSLSLFVWVLGYRYVILVVPFAFFYLLVAVQWLARRVLASAKTPCILPSTPGGQSQGRRDLPAALTAALALALVVSGLAVDLRRAERNLTVTRRQTLAEVYAADPEWTRWLESVSWLKANLPADAVVMGRKSDLLYLLSDRRTAEYPYSQDPAILLSALARNKVTHVLEDAFTWTRTTEIYLDPAMHSRPAAFNLLHETSEPVTRLWAVNAP